MLSLPIAAQAALLVMLFIYAAHFATQRAEVRPLRAPRRDRPCDR